MKRIFLIFLPPALQVENRLPLPPLRVSLTRSPSALLWVPHWGMLVQGIVRILGSVVKHQGNSWPSGFRQKFSLRSLENTRRQPRTRCDRTGVGTSRRHSLAGVGLRCERVVMGVLRVPALTRESCRRYVHGPPVAPSSALVTLARFHHVTLRGRICERAGGHLRCSDSSL